MALLRVPTTPRSVLTLTLGLGACAAPAPDLPGPTPAQYLFAWAYDQDERQGDTNFLAVIDVDSASPDYGRVVATAALGEVGGMPHHTELVLPPGGEPLFANSFHAGRTFLVDLSDPLRPAVTGEVDSVPGYRHPHSFLREPGGTVLATLQFGDGSLPGDPGGLARFGPDGRLQRVASSADPAFAGAELRTYSLDASASIDRVVTTSSPMAEVRTADVVQVWRLSDLSLLRTIPVPEVATDSAWRYPFEVRFLSDGRSAFLNTYYCGFYLLTGLDTDAPTIQRVLALEHPKYLACGVPLLIGHFWIMPVTGAREILVFDLSDPRAPRRVATLATDSTFGPHWSARDPNSDRVVFPSESDADPRILIARFDSTTGHLAWDESFRDPATGRLGISLDRADWPHGPTGAATPHGVIFGPRPGPGSRP